MSAGRRRGRDEARRPSELRVPAAKAKQMIEERIGAADPLLKTNMVPLISGALEQFLDDVENWGSTTYDLLSRLFDRSDMATSFLNARRMRIRTPYTPQNAIFNSAHESIRSQVRNLQGLLTKIDVMDQLPPQEQPASPAGGDRPTDVHIHITGNVLGNIVLQSTVDKIESHLQIAASEDRRDLADSLKRLAEAAGADPELTPSKKQEALELIEFLAESSALPSEKRRGAMIAAAMSSLGSVLTLATRAGEAWQQLEPMVEGALRGHLH